MTQFHKVEILANEQLACWQVAILTEQGFQATFYKAAGWGYAVESWK